MNPTDPTVTDRTSVTDRPIVVVWPEDEEPATARVFTPDEFAGWHEANHLSCAFPNPTAFYGITSDGRLCPLWHTCTTGDWDADDYTTVTHRWTMPGFDFYATGCARRDGRA